MESFSKNIHLMEIYSRKLQDIEITLKNTALFHILRSLNSKVQAEENLNDEESKHFTSLFLQGENKQ